MKTQITLLALIVSCFCFGQEMFSGSSPAAAGGSSTEFADTFTIGADADLNTHTTTTGGFAWTKAAGSGTINDISATGKAADQDVTGLSLYSVNHTVSSANYTVLCDVSYANNSDSVEADIGARYDGTAPAAVNSYIVAWFPDLTLIALEKVVAGSASVLGSTLTQAGTSHTLKLVVNGTTISAYSDGTLVTSVTDATFASAGKAAIGSGIRALRPGKSGSNSVTYDNLQVTVP